MIKKKSMEGLSLGEVQGGRVMVSVFQKSIFLENELACNLFPSRKTF